MGRANIVAATCVTCGAQFSRYIRPSRSMPKCCGPVCAGKMHLGEKQSAERVAARKKFGPEHAGWRGDDATIRAGRTRALRAFPDTRPCERCGENKKRIDRHHVDGNTKNNASENVQFLCRKCHMTVDGRITKMREVRYGQKH